MARRDDALRMPAEGIGSQLPPCSRAADSTQADIAGGEAVGPGGLEVRDDDAGGRGGLATVVLVEDYVPTPPAVRGRLAAAPRLEAPPANVLHPGPMMPE